MPDFPAALDAALHDWFRPAAGLKSDVSTKVGFEARLRHLEKAYGSKAAAARAAGVGPSSWRAWTTQGASGRPPTQASRMKVSLAYAQMLRDRAAGRRRPPTRMAITAIVVADPRGSRYVNRVAQRTFNADQLRHMASVVAAWQAGRSSSSVAREATEAIADAYGTEFAFEGDNAHVELS